LWRFYVLHSSPEKKAASVSGLWETECLRFCASEKTASLAATAPMPQMRDQYRAMARH
jgi:hypothetical protein